MDCSCGTSLADVNIQMLPSLPKKVTEYENHIFSVMVSWPLKHYDLLIGVG